MSSSLYIFSLLLFATTAILIFGIRAFAASRSARAAEGREEGLRELAERTAAGQADAAIRLAGLQAELSSVSARLGSIEETLSSVE